MAIVLISAKIISDLQWIVQQALDLKFYARVLKYLTCCILLPIYMFSDLWSLPAFYH